MTIDSHTSYIRLTEAAKHLPLSNGRKVHVKTIKRWVTKGIGGIRLRAKKLGAIWHTTLGWLHEFQDALTRQSLPPLIDPKATERQHNRDLRELQRRYGVNVRKYDSPAAETVEQAAAG